MNWLPFLSLFDRYLIPAPPVCLAFWSDNSHVVPDMPESQSWGILPCLTFPKSESQIRRLHDTCILVIHSRAAFAEREVGAAGRLCE